MLALAARIQHRRDTEKINMAPGQDDMQICEAFHILKNNQKLRNTFAQLRKPSTKQKGNLLNGRRYLQVLRLKGLKFVCVCVCREREGREGRKLIQLNIKK